MLQAMRIRHYMSFIESQGLPPETLLEDTGIECSDLANPSYLVALEQYDAVVGNLLRLKGNNGIGFDIGANTSLTDLGIVGYAMACSKTLGEAIRLWANYGDSPIGAPFTLQLTQLPKAESTDGNYWGVLAPADQVRDSVSRFYVEEILTAGIKNFGPLLTGVPFEIVEMSLNYAEPSYGARYREVFSCPVRFGAVRTRVVVKSPSLDAPIRSNDDDLRELCIRQCGLMIRQYTRDSPVAGRIRMALRKRGAIPPLETVADWLSMSPRTLRRHLQMEGTHYQKVINEFRCELAKEYVRHRLMPIKEIGYLLGFSQTSAFCRAFKSWTGFSVGQYATSMQAPVTSWRASTSQMHL